MSPERKKRLEAAGFVVTTSADWLGLTEAERKVVELRSEVARRVRELRQSQGLSQTALAGKLGVSQSRIPDLEQGKRSSLDALVGVYFALGGAQFFTTGATDPPSAAPAAPDVVPVKVVREPTAPEPVPSASRRVRLAPAKKPAGKKPVDA